MSEQFLWIIFFSAIKNKSNFSYDLNLVWSLTWAFSVLSYIFLCKGAGGFGKCHCTRAKWVSLKSTLFHILLHRNAYIIHTYDIIHYMGSNYYFKANFNPPNWLHLKADVWILPSPSSPFTNFKLIFSYAPIKQKFFRT